jgi:hypothetical protein
MASVCYECHAGKEKSGDVQVAEDAQQEGYAAIHYERIDEGVKLYKAAADILAQDPKLHCRQHVPPLFCAAVREGEFDSARVWLPGIMGPHVVYCQLCGKLRPCVSCDRITVGVTKNGKVRVAIQNIPPRRER